MATSIEALIRRAKEEREAKERTIANAASAAAQAKSGNTATARIAAAVDTLAQLQAAKDKNQAVADKFHARRAPASGTATGTATVPKAVKLGEGAGAAKTKKKTTVDPLTAIVSGERPETAKTGSAGNVHRSAGQTVEMGEPRKVSDSLYARKLGDSARYSDSQVMKQLARVQAAHDAARYQNGTPDAVAEREAMRAAVPETGRDRKREDLIKATISRLEDEGRMQTLGQLMGRPGMTDEEVYRASGDVTEAQKTARKLRQPATAKAFTDSPVTGGTTEMRSGSAKTWINVLNERTELEKHLEELTNTATNFRKLSEAVKEYEKWNEFAEKRKKDAEDLQAQLQAAKDPQEREDLRREYNFARYEADDAANELAKVEAELTPEERELYDDYTLTKGKLRARYDEFNDAEANILMERVPGSWKDTGNYIPSDIRAAQKTMLTGGGQTVWSGWMEKVQYLTPQEKRAMSYYIENGQEDQADALMQSLNTAIDTRIAEEKAQKIAGAGVAGLVATPVVSAVAGAVHNIEGIARGLSNSPRALADSRLEKTETALASAYASERMKNPDSFTVFGRSIGEVLADAGYNIGNQTIPMALNFIPVIGSELSTAEFAFSIYGNAKKEYLDAAGENGDEFTATNYAVLDALSEIGLEKVLGAFPLGRGKSLQTFVENATKGMKSAALRFVTETGLDIGGEITEETVQLFLEPMIKDAVEGRYNAGNWEDVNWDNVWYTVFSTALTTGAMGAMNAGNTMAKVRADIEAENRNAEYSKKGWEAKAASWAETKGAETEADSTIDKISKGEKITADEAEILTRNPKAAAFIQDMIGKTFDRFDAKTMRKVINDAVKQVNRTGTEEAPADYRTDAEAEAEEKADAEAEAAATEAPAEVTEEAETAETGEEEYEPDEAALTMDPEMQAQYDETTADMDEAHKALFTEGFKGATGMNPRQFALFVDTARQNMVNGILSEKMADELARIADSRENAEAAIRTAEALEELDGNVETGETAETAAPEEQDAEAAAQAAFDAGAERQSLPRDEFEQITRGARALMVDGAMSEAAQNWLTNNYGEETAQAAIETAQALDEIGAPETAETAANTAEETAAADSMQETAEAENAQEIAENVQEETAPEIAEEAVEETAQEITEEAEKETVPEETTQEITEETAEESIENVEDTEREEVKTDRKRANVTLTTKTGEALVNLMADYTGVPAEEIHQMFGSRTVKDYRSDVNRAGTYDADGKAADFFLRPVGTYGLRSSFDLANSKFTDAQKMDLAILDSLGKRGGVSIVLDMDVKADNAPATKKIRAMYDGGKREIHVSVQAMDKITALGVHEMVHYFADEKTGNRATFDSLVEAMRAMTKNFDENVRDYMEKYGYDEDTATQEAVADEMMSIVENKTFIDNMVKKNPSLARRIKDWLTEFRKHLEEMVKKLKEQGGITAKSMKGLVKARDDVTLAAQLFEVALEEVGETKQRARPVNNITHGQTGSLDMINAANEEYADFAFDRRIAADIARYQVDEAGYEPGRYHYSKRTDFATVDEWTNAMKATLEDVKTGDFQRWANGEDGAKVPELFKVLRKDVAADTFGWTTQEYIDGLPDILKQKFRDVRLIADADTLETIAGYTGERSGSEAQAVNRENFGKLSLKKLDRRDKNGYRRSASEIMKDIDAAHSRGFITPEEFAQSYGLEYGITNWQDMTEQDVADLIGRHMETQNGEYIDSLELESYRKRAAEYVDENYADMMKETTVQLVEEYFDRITDYRIGNEVTGEKEGTVKGREQYFSLEDAEDTNTETMVEEDPEKQKQIKQLADAIKQADIAKLDKSKLYRIAESFLSNIGSGYSARKLANDLERAVKFMNGMKEDAANAAMQVARELAGVTKHLLTTGKSADTVEFDRYTELRKELRQTEFSMTAAQLKQAAVTFGTVDIFRKENLGRFKLKQSGEASTTLTELYGKLNAKYPELFPKCKTDQMAVYLAAGMNATEKTVSVDFAKYGATLDENAYAYALEMVGRTMEAIGAGDAAKALAKELNQMRRKYETVLKERNREMNQKERAQMEVERLNERAESKQKRAMLDAIHNEATTMNDWIDENKKSSALTDKLHDNIAGWLKMLDPYNKTGEKTKKTFLENFNTIYSMLKNIEAAQSGRNVDVDIDEEYGMLASMAVTSDFVDKMGSFIETLGDKSLKDLSGRDVAKLRTIVREFKHLLTTANTVFCADNRAKYGGKSTNIGEQGIREMMEGRHNKIHAFEKIGKLLGTDMLDSVSFRHIAGEVVTDLFKQIDRGFLKATDRMTQVNKYVEELKGKIGITNRQIREASETCRTYTLESGEKITLTPAQVMSFYVLDRRAQAQGHLYKGGVQINAYVAKDAATGKRIRVEKSRVVHPTKADLQKMVASIDGKYVKMAEELQHYISTETSAWGNEITLALNGIRKYNEKNYWPISTSEDFTRRDMQSADMMVATLNAVKNMSFTKDLTKNASTPITLNDAFQVFTDHVTNQAMYNGLALPIEDAVRYYNYVQRNEQGQRTGVTVKTEMDLSMGRERRAWFEQFLRDMNHSGSRGDFGNFSNGLQSKMKANAIAGNLRVVVQQPTAIMRAYAVIDPKYLTRAIASSPLKQAINMFGKKQGLISEMQEHSSIARWKDQGSADINTGKSARQMIMGDNMDRVDYVVNKGMFLAGAADNITWATMWQAEKYRVESEFKDLKPGSDAYWAKVDEIFTDDMMATQVVDSPMTRSQIMRSKDSLTKMATSFMAEPTKSYNMFYRAVSDIVNKRGSGKKLTAALARTTAAYGASLMLNSVVQGLYDALKYRDDDDDFWDKFEEKFKSNLFSDMNPFGWIPFVKDIYDIVINGEDIERTDMSVVTDLANAARTTWKKINGESGQSWYQVGKNFATSASAIAGIPLSGVVKSTEWAINAAKPGTTVTKKKTITEEIVLMMEAAEEGDTEKIAFIRKKLRNAGKTDQQIDLAIAQHLRGDASKKDAPANGLVKEAYEAKKRGDMTAYRDIKTEAVSDLHVSAEAFVKAVNLYENMWHKLPEDDETTAEGANKALTVKTYSNEDLLNAARNGDIKDFAEAYETMLNESTAKDPKKTIASTVKSGLLEEYMEAKEKHRNVTEYENIFKTVGYTNEDMATWTKDWHNKRLKEAVENGDSQSMARYISELKADGKSEQDIASSLRSTYRDDICEAWYAGDKKTAKALYDALKKTGLHNKKGQLYFTDKWFDDMIKNYKK